MRLPKGLYDALKYTAQVGLPALATLFATIGPVWDFSHVDQIIKTIIAIDLFLGALLLLDSAQYTKAQKTISLQTDVHPAEVPIIDPPLDVPEK